MSKITVEKGLLDLAPGQRVRSVKGDVWERTVETHNHPAFGDYELHKMVMVEAMRGTPDYEDYVMLNPPPDKADLEVLILRSYLRYEGPFEVVSGG